MFEKISKVLLGIGLIWGVIGVSSEAIPIVQKITQTTDSIPVKLEFVDSETLHTLTLGDVLKEYNYDKASLPQTEKDLDAFAEMYSIYTPYLLRCNSKFWAPLKAVIWRMKFSLIVNETYPDEELQCLNNYCALLKGMSESRFKTVLISVLFQSEGLRGMYSEIKDQEKKFGKDLYSNSLRTDFNSLLDLVDPDEHIERFKK